MSASLENQFISDRYTSLLHLSGNNLTGELDYIYDGLGNQTPIQISDDTVVINNVEQPSTTSKTTLFDIIFPINTIYLTVDNVNPETRFTGTTWEQVSEGRYLAGVGTGTDKNNTTQSFTSESAGDTIGEYAHTLTISEIPSHNHALNTTTRRYGRTNGSDRTQSGRDPENRYADTSFTGGDQSHNNTPPYFGVYIWKRIA